MQQQIKIKNVLILIAFLLLMNGCSYTYIPKGIDKLDVEITSIADVNETNLLTNRENFNFKKFINGSLVKFNNHFKLFKITVLSREEAPQALLILPHYFDDVEYFDDNFKLLDSVKRNHYKVNRVYSTNILAFDVNPEVQYFYILAKNKQNRKMLFTLEERLTVRNYDQKLSFTFVAVYSAILTLFFINLIFYFFVKKKTYLYYAMYLFFSLFALFFQEGFIAYFPKLSYEILGIYTQIFWLKLPTLFFWLFIFKFLELKKRSKLDFNIVKILFILDIVTLALTIMFHLLHWNGISPYFSLVINIYSLIAILFLLYISVKYTSLKVSMAKYLLVGWFAYYGALVLRVFYALNVEPLAFWMPRAFEFGLLINALALSFGLADNTMRLIQDKDKAQKKIAIKDRTLFCNELVKSFQSRSNQTIVKYYGNQKRLGQKINNSFVSTIMQLIDVKDVFYIYELNSKLGFQKISSNEIGFNIAHFVEDNKDLLNAVCEQNKAAFNISNLRDYGEMPFVIIPISNHKYDNLCLFLTIPNYEIASPEVIDDINQFANDMTIALIETRKFKKTTDAARFDGLTHLLNRKAIMEKLTDIINLAKLTNNTITFAFIDIDDFKNINDKYGHDVGDDCLVFLSDQLRSRFKENCYTGRFGGDEFIVLLNNIPLKEIDKMFKSLYGFLNKNTIKGITVEISVGIAMATSENNLFNVKKLMKAADISLYEAKHKGKNQYAFSKWSDQAKIL